MRKICTMLLVYGLAMCSCGDGGEGRPCPDANCNHYATQAQAQAAFDDDKECLGELDHDSDGMPCEHLSNNSGGSGGSGTGGTGAGGSGCPTTSNCGCSGIKKDDCGGVCCAWVVGAGCICK